MDRILIDDLRVMTIVGALPHEREIAQPVRIDLSIGLDLRNAGLSDELADTVHYGLVCERVSAMVCDSKDVLLERLAGKVADFYELEVDSAVDAMSSLLEPLIMLVLGILIGGLVIAMYLPIFKLGSVV